MSYLLELVNTRIIMVIMVKTSYLFRKSFGGIPIFSSLNPGRITTLRIVCFLDFSLYNTDRTRAMRKEFL